MYLLIVRYICILGLKVEIMNNLNNPLVSIIVPVYNVQNYIEQCLASLVEQSYENIEIILVNDGSTDNSLAICNTFGAKDSRIKIINQDNAGVNQARINGFRRSTGDYIMFVDSDDYVSTDIVYLMTEVVKEFNVDLVSCQHYDVVNNVINPSIIRPSLGYYNRERIDSLLKDKFLHDSSINLAGMTGFLWGRLFKRDYMKSALEAGRDLIYCEDQVALFDALCKIKSMYVMDKWLYYYIQHTNQATRSYNKSYWSNFELYFDRLTELDEKGYLKQQMYNRALNMVRELIRMEFERGNASFWEQLNDCKKNFSQKLFLLAKLSNSVGLNIKVKFQRILIIYKQIFIYGLFLYVNRIIKNSR